MRSEYRQIAFVKFFRRGFVGERFSANFALVMRFSSVCGTCRFDFFVSDERMFMLFGFRIAKRSVRLYSSDVIAEFGITPRRTRIRKVFAVFITEPDFCIARNHLDDNRKPLAFFYRYRLVEFYGYEPSVSKRLPLYGNGLSARNRRIGIIVSEIEIFVNFDFESVIAAVYADVNRLYLLRFTAYFAACRPIDVGNLFVVAKRKIVYTAVVIVISVVGIAIRIRKSVTDRTRVVVRHIKIRVSVG